jgi:hypothetical protein
VKVCNRAPLSPSFHSPRSSSPPLPSSFTFKFKFKFKFKQSAHLILFSASNLPSARLRALQLQKFATSKLRSLRELSHCSSLVKTQQWLIHPDFLQKPRGGSVEGSSNCTLLVPRSYASSGLVTLTVNVISHAKGEHCRCHPAGQGYFLKSLADCGMDFPMLGQRFQESHP